jgi:hypothetical protein
MPGDSIPKQLKHRITAVFSTTRQQGDTMKLHLCNRNGFALVYSLVILVLASIGGTALLFMTQRGNIEASDYTSMRSSSLAAVAALKACEGQFLNDPNTALSLLKGYLYNSKEWLLGSAPSSTPQKIPFWNGADSPEYAARIIGYDSVNQYVIIEGIGYGSYGGRKKAIGAYQLSGLGLSDNPIGTKYALFLGGQLENCNEPISIQGDVYLSAQGNNPWTNTTQHFNRGGKINGDFKTASTNQILDFTNTIWITGNAFWQCGLMPQAELRIDGLAGFTFTGGYQNWNQTIQLKNNAWVIAPYNLPGSRINGLSDKTVRYCNPVTSGCFTGFGNIWPASLTASSIATSLGSTADDESTFGLSLPTWKSGVVENISGDVWGSTLENLWTAHEAAGTLFQEEWLVLQMNGTTRPKGGSFTKKAIIMTGNNYLNANGVFFNCSDEANLFIIANGSGALQGLGPGDDGNFRGMIYVNSSNLGNMTYQFGSNSRFYGVIHHASQTKFDINDGNADSARIWFGHPLGQSAMQEIANSGILTIPGQTGTTRTMVLKDMKIRPTLQFMQL